MDVGLGWCRNLGITFLNQHDSYVMLFNSKITYDKIKIAFYCMKSDFNRILRITNVKNWIFFVCLLWCIVCGLTDWLEVQLLSSLHLTAFLLQLHLLLLPSAWLCFYSPRRPDHGKCTHPGCSPPQTEWPVSKQAQHSALGFPKPL